MPGMCRGQTRQFQHDCNVSLSNTSVSAWLQCVAVEHLSFSMTVMYRLQIVRLVSELEEEEEEEEEEEDS